MTYLMKVYSIGHFLISFRHNDVSKKKSTVLEMSHALCMFFLKVVYIKMHTECNLHSADI